VRANASNETNAVDSPRETRVRVDTRARR